MNDNFMGEMTTVNITLGINVVEETTIVPEEIIGLVEEVLEGGFGEEGTAVAMAGVEVGVILISKTSSRNSNSKS